MIWMLDKEIGSCLNNDHDPPPAESYIENGRTGGNNYKRNGPPDKHDFRQSCDEKMKASNEAVDQMSEVMTNVLQMISTLLQNKR
jgi:hypothetical protein